MTSTTPPTIAFDPSLTATGYAVGHRYGARVQLVEAGVLGRMTRAQVKASTIAERCRLIYDDAIGLMRSTQPAAVVIETPAPKQPQVDRIAKGQARYGMAVGAALAAAWRYRDERSGAVDVITSDADDWTRGQKKENRQLVIIDQFPEYDPKRDSGLNISDAIGLLCWWAEGQMLEDAG